MLRWLSSGAVDRRRAVVPAPALEDSSNFSSAAPHHEVMQDRRCVNAPTVSPDSSRHEVRSNDADEAVRLRCWGDCSHGDAGRASSSHHVSGTSPSRERKDEVNAVVEHGLVPDDSGGSSVSLPQRSEDHGRGPLWR